MVVVALLVAACGTTVDPITSFVPSPTPRPADRGPERAAVPCRRPTRPTGEAPCGQAEAPDAAHAAYTGQIRRISATDPETVVFELCGPDVAFRSKIAAPAFAINDAGWLESHIDPATSGAQAIVSEVNGTGPYRLESWSRGSEVSLARNDDVLGRRGPERTRDRPLVRRTRASASPSSRTPPSTGSTTSIPSSRRGGRPTTSACSSRRAPG